MSTGVFIAIFAIVLVACVFQASTGFGANLIAQPLIFQFEPGLVPGSVLMATAFLSCLVAYRDRASIKLGAIGVAVGGAVIGIGIGALVIRQISEPTLAIVIAICVLAMVALSSFGRAAERSARNIFLAGNAGGFGSVTAGIGGPPLALLFADADADPGHTRGFLATYFLAASAFTFIGLVAAGRFGIEQTKDGAALLPAALVGFALSRPLLPLVDRGFTRPAILIVSAASALLLLVRTLAG